MTLARGPWVEAVKRYDPGLRVRWSPEKKKWAVDAPARTFDPRWLCPPSRWVRDGDAVREKMLPHDGERWILWHDRRYAVLYSAILDRRLLEAVVSGDAARVRGNFRSFLHGKIYGNITRKHAQGKKVARERSLDAYGRWRFLLRKDDIDATGISMKGWNPRHEGGVTTYA